MPLPIPDGRWSARRRAITWPSNTSGTALDNKSHGVFPFFLLVRLAVAARGLARGGSAQHRRGRQCLLKNPATLLLGVTPPSQDARGGRVRAAPAGLAGSAGAVAARATSGDRTPPPHLGEPLHRQKYPSFFPPIFVSSYVYHILSRMEKKRGEEAVREAPPPSPPCPQLVRHAATIQVKAFKIDFRLSVTFCSLFARPLV